MRAVPTRSPELAPTPKPTPKVFVALPNYNEETATRLQIFLDNSDFGPGKIDGKMGEFFRKALVSFKHARALPVTGVVDQWMLDQVPQTFTTYTIKGDDLAFVGNLPTAHDEQAKLKFLPYTSMLEFVAERYHAAETFIQKLNPGMDWEHLEPGDELKVPNVLPFEIEKVKEMKIVPNKAFAARKIYVDTTERLLEVFDNDLGYSSMTNTPTLTARGDFHVRGSSTSGYVKDSFFLEIRDEFDQGRNVSLLGLPDESDCGNQYIRSALQNSF